MATQTKFQIYSANLVKGVHNFNSNTIKVMLTNTVCRKGESPWLAWWHEPAMQWVRLRKESPDVQPTHWLPIPPMEEE